jgi:hypothetical protein
MAMLGVDSLLAHDRWSCPILLTGASADIDRMLGRVGADQFATIPDNLLRFGKGHELAAWLHSCKDSFVAPVLHEGVDGFWRRHFKAPDLDAGVGADAALRTSHDPMTVLQAWAGAGYGLVVRAPDESKWETSPSVIRYEMERLHAPTPAEEPVMAARDAAAEEASRADDAFAALTPPHIEARGWATGETDKG